PSWSGPPAGYRDARQHSKVGVANGMAEWPRVAEARTMIGNGDECVQCRGALPAGAKFCPSCGTPVGARTGAAPEPVPAGERRQVCVLFADLAGYTRMSSGL